MNRTNVTSKSHDTDSGNPSQDLAARFAAIARALAAQTTLEGTQQQIVDLAVQTIGGCTGAGITQADGERVLTLAATDAHVRALDAMQYSSGEGPALAAIAEHRHLFSDDLANDERWPALAALVAASGPCSAASVSLVGGARPAALNLYAAGRAAFVPSARAEAQIFAAHAGVALAAATALADAEAALALEVDRLEHLHGALAARQVMGRAEGILMAQEHVTPNEAFDLLREASERLDTRVRDVARHVVETGELPGV